jgi:transmembrane 9 superfamily protein 2/4
MMRVSAIILVVLLASLANAIIILPGMLPRDYPVGSQIDMKVNKMTSPRTQLPYSYYSLDFCRPEKIVDSRENLGEMLLGDKIENSAYQIYALGDIPCKVLCKRDWKAKDKALKLFKERISEEYRVHWLLDGLPAATKREIQDGKGHEKKFYEDGFALGIKDADGRVYLNNHVSMTILYHREPAESSTIRVVGFEVVPESIQHDLNFNMNDEKSVPATCSNHGRRQEINPDTDTTIVFTYSVHWEHSDIPWASRWDVYLLMVDDQIHWFSIINSLMIVLFLTGMVAMIMIRTLRADLRRYNMPLDQDDIQEETGWKLVHGDVFRPPKWRMLLSVLCGTGVQVFSMYLVLMVFALLGFLSPANRGSLLMAMPVLFVLMGVCAGYFSASTYKIMQGENWKRNTLMTALLLPGIVFLIVIFLNFFLVGEGSSGAVGFGTIFSLMALWFGVSMPLVFFGAYWGFRKPAMEFPVRTNLIPRLIPEQVWYMKPVFSVLMGGVLPFGVVFIELFFILSSIWQQQFYYLWVFLFIVFLILVVTCAEITIVMCYFQLCSEDYHWWWRAFLTSGASALYMYLYAVFYFFTRLNIIGFVSGLLYFGYTFIMAITFFVLTGSIGFYACMWFVRKIYSSVHLA